MNIFQKFINSRLVARWCGLLSVALSPGFFLGVVVAGISLFLSVLYKDNVPFSNMMAIVGSIFGGVAGAFFKDEYDRISNKNILEKKGRSALRNLQGIRTQLTNIEAWVAEFGKRARKKEDRNTLDEINRHIATIDLNIAAGLEDWEDIVPELKERNRQEAIIEKKYREAAESVMVELLEKRKELAVAGDEKLSQEIEKKIGHLEKQIREIKKEASMTPRSGGWGGSIPLAPGGKVSLGGASFYGSSYFGGPKCLECGKSLKPTPISAGVASIYDSSYCDDCKKIHGGSVI